MIIDSPSFLNKAMIFFLILSSTGSQQVPHPCIALHFLFQLSSIIHQEDKQKINKRLSDLSCNEEEYEKAKPVKSQLHE